MSHPVNKFGQGAPTKNKFGQVAPTKTSRKNKKFSRMAITAAGRNRLANKRANAGGVDAGITQDALNWAKMAEQGMAARAGMSNADRMADTAKGLRGAKVLRDAEKKISYEAGNSMNVSKYQARNAARRKTARSDAHIIGDRGKENIYYNQSTGTKHNSGPKGRGSTFNQLKDTLSNSGDKYDAAGSRRTSSEERRERLKRKTAAQKVAARKRAKSGKKSGDSFAYKAANDL